MTLCGAAYFSIQCMPVQSRLLIFFHYLRIGVHYTEINHVIFCTFILPKETAGSICISCHEKFSISLIILQFFSAFLQFKLIFPELAWPVLYKATQKFYQTFTRPFLWTHVVFYYTTNEYKQNFIFIYSRKWTVFTTLWKMAFPVFESNCCYEIMFYVIIFHSNIFN